MPQTQFLEKPQSTAEETQAIAAPSSQQPTLRRGDTGPAVQALQQRLNAFVDPIVVDGIFGPRTEFAVRTYQYSRFLTEDGIVGPLTGALLQDPMTPHLPTLQFLDERQEVRWVQEVLLTLGYYRHGDEPARVDGLFLELTEQAVRRYQESTDAIADGIVGPITWSQLGFDRLDTKARQRFRQITLLNRQKRHANSITAIATGSKTGLVFTGSRDTTARAWSARGKALEPVFEGDQGSISCIALEPQGRELAISTFGGTVSLAQRQGLAPILRFPGRGGSVLTLDISPNGELMATGHSDRTVRLFNFNGDLQATLPKMAQDVTGVAFSPRGGQLVTTTTHFQFLLWNGIHGENKINPRATVLSRAGGNAVRRSTAQFSPSGLKIAIATGPSLSIYSDQGLRLHVSNEQVAINDIAFSPCGTYLALACGDATVRVIALRDLDNTPDHPAQILQGHVDSVESVAFASTGAFLYSGDRRGELITWSLS